MLYARMPILCKIQAKHSRAANAMKHMEEPWAIVILNWNNAPDTIVTVQAIQAWKKLSPAIWVVDNGSQDDSVESIQQACPGVRLLLSDYNRGFAAAVNQGLAATTAPFVLLLNPDAALLPSTLAQLVHHLQSQPDVAAVGPRQWLNADRVWQWGIVPRPPHWRDLLARRSALARRSLTPHWALSRAIWRDDQPTVVTALSGACLLLRRSALEAVGGLDEGFFLFYEKLGVGFDKLCCAR